MATPFDPDMTDPRAMAWIRERYRRADESRRVAGKSLLAFTRRMWPGFQTPRHIRLIADELEKAAVTPDSRLIITIPRRHGKSLLVSEHFPAWYLGQFPDRRIVAVSHTDAFAWEFSRATRAKFWSKSWPFPGVRTARGNSAVKAWRIDGSNTGGYASYGRGGKPTGRGADVILIDDPIGSVDEAESSTVRDDLWAWYRETLRPILEPGGSIILVSTRWHADDLTGRLLAAQADGTGEQWTSIDLPARCIDPDTDPFGREEDEPLWPERWTSERLAAIYRSVGERAWQAQYQGRPAKPGGDMVRLEWFPTYDRIPPTANKVVQVWDTAFKAQKRHDYSVCLTAMVSPTNAYVVDVFRAKLEWPQLQRAYVSQTRAWNPAESCIEDRASGTSLIQHARSSDCPTTAPVIALPKVMDKEKYANLVSPSWEAGRVLLPASAYWLDAFKAELEDFPAGAHDDQFDTIAHLTYRLYHQVKRRGASSSSYLDGAQPANPYDDSEDEPAWLH